MDQKLRIRKTITKSEIKYMKKNMRKIERLIDNYEDKDVADVDDFISTEDKASELILDYLAEEKACDETLDVLKEKFREKEITFDEYLNAARILSDTQFMHMAKRRKIMSVLSANNR